MIANHFLTAHTNMTHCSSMKQMSRFPAADAWLRCERMLTNEQMIPIIGNETDRPGIVLQTAADDHFSFINNVVAFEQTKLLWLAKKVKKEGK